MIQDKIKQICQEIGPEVQLLVVTKGRSVEAIEAALAAGHRAFGENRVQEAQEKFAPLRAKYPDIELHMIGPLQTNKVGRAVALFDVIQTLDRPKLAEKVAHEAEKLGKSPRLYIETNVGREAQKAGVAPDQVAAFLAQCHDQWGLDVEGLMAIPPRDEDPVPYFKQMKLLQDNLGLPKLSMGMSSDYMQAVACGASMVRVGRSIFVD